MSNSTTFKLVGRNIKEIAVVTPEDQSEQNIIKYINSCNFKNKLQARTAIYSSKDTSVPTFKEKALALTLIDSMDIPESGPIVTEQDKAFSDSMSNVDFTSVTPEIKYSPFKVHYFVKQGFYLLYDTGVCYIKTKQDSEYPLELVVKTEGGFASPNSIQTDTVSFKYRNMSQTEYDSIVKASPSLEDILKVYQKKYSKTTGWGGGLEDNRLTKVNFNFNNIVAIF